MCRLLPECRPLRKRKADRPAAGAGATVGLRSWSLILRRAAAPFTVRRAEFGWEVPVTTQFDKEMIQTGWSVWTADGQELGTIIATDPATMTIKKRGLLGGEVQVPRDKVDEVETGRVELTLTKDEVDALKS
jgi:hypothetical protein